MTSNAREWGLTILRLWMGFLITYSGYLRVSKDIGLSNLIPSQLVPLSSWLNASIHLVFLIGGAAIFLGIAVRLAALFTGLAAAYTVFQNVKTNLLYGLIDSSHSTTIFVVCVVFILMGPGRLNLGAALRARR